VSLDVAMLTPCFWPEVRRGTERMVHEVSSGLIARGHRARVITSHRGFFATGEEEGVPVLRVPRPPDGRLRRRSMEDHLLHVPIAYAALRAQHPQIAHAWFTTDAMAAARYRRETGRPAVHSYMGIPDHTGLMWRRKRLHFTVRALKETDRTVALSEHAAEMFRKWLGYDPLVIPPPVDVETFAPGPERTETPTIVCAAAVEEPRKRVELLIRAMPRIRKEHPKARLLVNRPRDLALAASVEDAENGVELADMNDRSTLAALYGAAWASALPSHSEAFGLVLAEAMACGTPGVGAAEGGIPEVIDRPQVGRLFAGEDEAAVAKAVLETFELAQDAGTAKACRERALELSTAACAEAYERLYLELLDGRA
jgi:glycosyltransferase involved in cell wall biosynthesis